MTTSQTLTLNYNSDGLSKLEIPKQAVQPGEPVRIYLWGRSAEDLMGYKLGQGAENLGPGTLRQYPGQTTEAYFDLAGDGAAQDFDWPVLSLASVTAYGNLYAVDGNDVSLVALPGEDVTRYFRLSGNALVRNVETGAPTITGSVRAVANRSPWCREWRWTAPDLGISQRTRLAIRYSVSPWNGGMSQVVRPAISSDTPVQISSYGIVAHSDVYDNTPGYGIESHGGKYLIYAKEIANGAGGLVMDLPQKIQFERDKINSISLNIKVPMGYLDDGVFETLAVYCEGPGCYAYVHFTFGPYGYNTSFYSWISSSGVDYYWPGILPIELRDGELHNMSVVFTNSECALKIDGNTIASEMYNGSIFNFTMDRITVVDMFFVESGVLPEKSRSRLASAVVSVS